MYQDAVNKKYGTDFQIPGVFYSQLMAVDFPGLRRNGLWSQIINQAQGFSEQVP